MPMLILVAILAIFVGSLSFSVVQEDRYNQSEAELDAIAASMLIYHNSVSSYAANNPATTGSVNDNLLSLPSWYRKIGAISNYVDNGKSYVYLTGNPAVAGAIAKRTFTNSVGFKRGGVLVGTKQGITSVTIPSQVPEESVVITQ